VSPESRKLALRLEFSGENYCGWQIQSESDEQKIPSIQGSIEKALKIIFRSSARIATQGCGRTDAGVHAREYFCNFSLPTDIEFDFSDRSIEKLRQSLNGLIPDSIAVTDVFRQEEDFHILNEVCWKTYEYSILFRSSKPVFMSERVWGIPEEWNEFNTTDFLKAVQMFEGEHDFKAFAASNHDAKTTIRKIFEMKTILEPYGVSVAQRSGVLLRLRITGEGFLKQMVRNIVGAIVEVGQNKRSLSDTYQLLAEGKSRAEAGRCAPARGLSLIEVSYRPWGAES